MTAPSCCCLHCRNGHCPGCPAAAPPAEEPAAPPEIEDDYWVLARRPLACLVFLMPLLAVYEVGTFWMGGDNPAMIRNGADSWMRGLLEALGVPFGFLLPVLVMVVLLAWHLSARHPWKVSPETLVGMFSESLLFALVLIVSGQLQNLAFQKLGDPEVPLPTHATTAASGSMLSGETAAQAVTYVGAGIYEEVLFRLCLLPTCFGLFRVLQLNATWAALLAVLATSLTFALAHHVGPTGEPLRLFPFTFRALAGLFFAGLFVVRGFGITVGAHAAYDLLVGLLLVPAE